MGRKVRGVCALMSEQSRPPKKAKKRQSKASTVEKHQIDFESQ